MSSHGYRFKALNDLKIGLDIEAVKQEFKSFVASENGRIIPESEPLIFGPGGSDCLFMETSELINMQCKYYFQLDQLKSLVPENI
jgi:hypothetical protein